jgi:hypothetical protein
MNDKERKNSLDEIISDTKKVKDQAMKNSKDALNETFGEKYKEIIDEKLNQETKVSEVSEQEIDEVISELENEVSKEPTKNSMEFSEENLFVDENTYSKSKSDKKPTFFQILSLSIHRKHINNSIRFRRRMQKRTGIEIDNTVAILTLKEGIVVNLTEIPLWYDFLRYKLCGFKYEVV